MSVAFCPILSSTKVQENFLGIIELSGRSTGAKVSRRHDAPVLGHICVREILSLRRPLPLPPDQCRH